MLTEVVVKWNIVPHVLPVRMAKEQVAVTQLPLLMMLLLAVVMESPTELVVKWNVVPSLLPVGLAKECLLLLESST